MVSISVCLLTHDRADEVAEAVASIGSSADEIVVLDNASTPPLAAIDGTVHLRSDENTGVARGRNQVAEAATGDVLIFIDDDAVAKSDIVETVRARFAEDGTLGLLAFKVTRPGGAVESKEVPFRGRFDQPVERASECAYFVGCGYAARAAALDATGGYDPSFFYSTEEIELAVRVSSAGWRVAYSPDAWVEHRPSERGRGDAGDLPGLFARNRAIYARKHLRGPVAAVHVSVWVLRTLVMAARQGQVRRWGRHLIDGLRLPVERTPLAWSEHVRLHRLGGRILY